MYDQLCSGVDEWRHAAAALLQPLMHAMLAGPLLPRRDVSSYTRVAVLQTWGYLAEHRALPLGHWQLVTDIAIGEPLLVPGCLSELQQGVPAAA